MKGFDKTLLKAAYEAADIGGTLTIERNKSLLDELYEMSTKTILSNEEKSILRYELSRDRELYLERLLRDTPCYVAFLNVWLVDKAKEECSKRYGEQYNRNQSYAMWVALGLVMLAFGSVFGAGMIVAKSLF